MKKFIKKLMSILIRDIENLEKEKKELETLKGKEESKSFYEEHKKKREILGCKPTLKSEKAEEKKPKKKSILSSLLDLSLSKLFYVFVAVLLVSWIFVKIHIPIPVVEVLVGLFMVMYFHLEIRNMPKKVIYSSTWIQYILAFLIPGVFYTISYMVIILNPKILELLLFRKFYIDKLNYVGLGVVLTIASSIRLLVFTFKKINTKKEKSSSLD